MQTSDCFVGVRPIRHYLHFAELRFLIRKARIVTLVILQKGLFSTVTQPAVNNPERPDSAMDGAGPEQLRSSMGNWLPKLSMTCGCLAPMHLIADQWRSLDPAAAWEPAKGREAAFPAVWDAADTQSGGCAEAWLSGRSLDRRAH